MTVTNYTTMTIIDSDTSSNMRRRPPTIISAMKKSTAERWSGWAIPTQDSENNSQMKRMIARAIVDSIRTTLKNHVIEFNRKLYMQVRGAAIGVSVAGDGVHFFII